MTTRRRLLATTLAALPLGAATAIQQRVGPAVVQPRAEATTLGAIAAAHGLTYGAAVENNLLASDTAYASLIAAQCALIMPAYETKFAVLEPAEGKFQFGPLDALIRWATIRNKQMRGHALIWHQQVPPWALTALAEGPARARAVMASYLGHVLEHTQNFIPAWDVVNEPVADPPGSDTPQATGELRDGPWLKALGPGYIDFALRLARDRDPRAKIAINEYGVEEDTPYCQEKRRRLLALVRRLRQANVPLDQIGIQAHLQMVRPFSPAVLTAYCRQLRAEGLELVVTEMDVREHWNIPHDFAARDKLVADRVKAFVDAALEGGIRTFITWGLVDRYSWLVSDPGVARTDGLQHRGLPFDWDGHPKPYWQAMANAFATAPAR